MGKKSEFTRSRFKEVRQKREERAQHTREVRDRRRGIDKSARLIDKVILHRALPDAAQRSLLLGQFAQASRLAAPSTDLCALMRHYAALAETSTGETTAPTTSTTSSTPVSSRKRSREEAELSPSEMEAGMVFLDAVADALLQTESAPAVVDAAGAADDMEAAVDGDAAAELEGEDEDPLTVLVDILQDDSGRRVVASLLAALSAVHSRKCAAVAAVVLAQFEENAHLPQHHVACRVLSALVQYGDGNTRQGVLDLLRQRATSIEAVIALLSDRHTAGTVERLLEFHRTPTTEWLCDVLSLTNVAPQKVAADKKSKKKKLKRAAEAVDTSVSTEQLMELINGAVSAPVLLQLAQTDARTVLLHRLSVTDLLQSKRGTTFLTELLARSADGTQEVAAVAALFDELLSRLGGDAGTMAIDKRANFVVQGLMRMLPAMGAEGSVRLQTLTRALGGAAGVSALVSHGIGFHVVMALIETAFQMQSEAAVEELAEILVTRQTVQEMLLHQFGSIVARSLMPLITRKTSKAGRLLQGMVEQDLSSLVYTEAGNLVVQTYLTAIGKAGASLLAQKLASSPEELAAMCRNPYASHVVFALFELVDPAAHTALCTALKPQVLRLCTHLNGRFIVEKMILASREIREDVVRQFVPLAQERGTQHLLCSVLASLDKRGKTHVVEKMLLPHFSELATHQCGSIALQKLMQADSLVLAAVQARLAENSLMRSDLAQNFFGKFVVQIAQQPTEAEMA